MKKQQSLSAISEEGKEITPLASIQDEATILISQAINKKVDVATMEKLLAMRRELRQEKAKEEFDRAMASFQAQCPTIERRKQGYNYKYAPLESIVQQVKDLLSANGFSYTFDTDEAENAVIIFCNVKHIAGHAEVSKATIKKETTTKMNASQQSGAAMTYGKRYAFCNAFGILTGDDDTDGATPKVEVPMSTRQMAEQKELIKDTTPIQVTNHNGAQGEGTISDKQIKFIYSLLEQKGHTEKELFVKYDVASVKQLTREQASTIIANLINLPDQMPSNDIDVDPKDVESMRS